MSYMRDLEHRKEKKVRNKYFKIRFFDQLYKSNSMYYNPTKSSTN